MNPINASEYINPAYIQIGLYEYCEIIKPIIGFNTIAEIAPAEPENPTTVEEAALPKTSVIVVM